MRQQQIGIHQRNSVGDSKQYTEHTSLNSTAGPTITPSDLDLGSTSQETGQDLCGQTPTHPSIIPDWHQPFHEWLPTRRQWVMSVEGLGDPLLCRSFWIQMFGGWLRLEQLLSSQGISDLTALPHCWDDVFDLWLKQSLHLDPQGPDPPHTSAPAPSSASAGLGAFPTSPTAPYAHSASPQKGCKRISNVVSKLTLQEIQEACRSNGAEEHDVARIAVVFPGVVSRDRLMLTRGPSTSAGHQREHQGYMEFAGRCMVNAEDVKTRRGGRGAMIAGQVQRYYCKLCGPVKHPRWKNSKDLLGHVWDTHCDPQGNGEHSLSFEICAAH